MIADRKIIWSKETRHGPFDIAMRSAKRRLAIESEHAIS
jgi:hypothetical protein